TLLALSARIWPSLTITVANGRPPSITFCRARSMVRCAKSITVLHPKAKLIASCSILFVRRVRSSGVDTQRKRQLGSCDERRRDRDDGCGQPCTGLPGRLDRRPVRGTAGACGGHRRL